MVMTYTDSDGVTHQIGAGSSGPLASAPKGQRFYYPLHDISDSWFGFPDETPKLITCIGCIVNEALGEPSL